MSSQYRRKPTLVTARGPITESETVETLHGEVIAETGSWILTDSFDTWPITAEAFAATYEPVADERDTLRLNMRRFNELLQQGFSPHDAAKSIGIEIPRPGSFSEGADWDSE